MANIDRWFGRLANASSLWTVAPAGALGIMSGILSTGVAWIDQFGAFGWFTSGLVGFVVAAFGFAAIARARLWLFDLKYRARLTAGSSAFDPMASTYEGKRLFLSDLAPAGRKGVMDKKFINCEIIGPGNVILDLPSDKNPQPHSSKTNLFDSDCVQVERTARPQNAVSFWGCDFMDCKFYNMTLLFVSRVNEGLNWITPKPEPLKIEDLSHDQTKPR